MKTVFSVESMPRNYKRAQSGELKEYEGVQRSSAVQFIWKSEYFPWSVQSEEDVSVSVICELL
jgi:hypothetical protein